MSDTPCRRISNDRGLHAQCAAVPRGGVHMQGALLGMNRERTGWMFRPWGWMLMPSGVMTASEGATLTPVPNSCKGPTANPRPLLEPLPNPTDTHATLRKAGRAPIAADMELPKVKPKVRLVGGGAGEPATRLHAAGRDVHVAGVVLEELAAAGERDGVIQALDQRLKLLLQVGRVGQLHRVGLVGRVCSLRDLRAAKTGAHPPAVSRRTNRRSCGGTR